MAKHSDSTHTPFDKLPLSCNDLLEQSRIACTNGRNTCLRTRDVIERTRALVERMSAVILLFKRHGS